MLPVRVAAEHRGRYEIWGHAKTTRARVAGRLRQDASRADLPAVGDWALAPRRVRGLATLAHVFERRTVFLRKAAGHVTEAQVVAANVDTVLLVCSLNRDFSARRIERYLTQLFESGATPVVVLSKADLAPGDSDTVGRELAAQLDVEVVVTTSREPSSIEALARYVRHGETVALVGSSGVGKSTIINFLVGESTQLVRDVREGDDRGRHTTRHRQLIALPGGGLLIDTPGMRELALWDGSAGLGEAFDDVLAIAARCRFRDCHHEGEPGCAMPDALQSGQLDGARLEHWRTLSHEAQTQAARREQKGRSEGTRPPDEQGDSKSSAGWRDLERDS